MAVEGFSVEVDNDPDRGGAAAVTGDGKGAAAVTVTVAGDVDLAAADTLWSVLDEYVRPGAHVVVDCSRVAFLDSMGLRTLIRAQHKAAAADARLTLAAPSEAVLRVLQLAGVADLFVLDISGDISGSGSGR
ncbi:STAS domain-containing protein [Catenulispora pinisilvae]|uniref:STAS domain-containing protein n=1 Tax=Catenulispora pinisilvae TaxID=2705253 RepID=UPI0018917ABB|nr:STAS domain-containing protein [Catenulispora pinisilvae]